MRFDSIQGHSAEKRALEIALSGDHSILFLHDDAQYVIERGWELVTVGGLS